MHSLKAMKLTKSSRLPVFAMLSLWALVATGCPGPSFDGSWTTLSEELDGVLLSAWQGPDGDAWVAGGALGSGGEGLIMHLEQGRFVNVPTGISETLWWVWAAGPSDAFFVGEGGVILHHDGETLEAMTSPTTATLYGIWGSSADDVWAVGGDAQGTGETDVLLHYQGGTWTQVALDAPPGVALFKVWGSADDDVFVVGQSGTILHYDGAAWATMDSGSEVPLFTVHGRSADDVWAVGGPSPTILHFDGTGWSSVATPGPGSVLNGVAENAAGELLIVGANGLKWRRDAEGMWFDDFESNPISDLHGVSLNDQGQALVVGGNFNAPIGATRRGALGHFGSNPPSLSQP